MTDLSELQTLTEGLTFRSETDAALEIVQRESDEQWPPKSAMMFAVQMGLKGVAVKELPTSCFWQSVYGPDEQGPISSARVRKLRA